MHAVLPGEAVSMRGRTRRLQDVAVAGTAARVLSPVPRTKGDRVYAIATVIT